MKVEYQLTVQCQCPKGDISDTYVVRVFTDRQIWVEELLADAAQYETRQMSQEHLTQVLANLWKAVVKTHGAHSKVITVVECEPKCPQGSYWQPE